MEIDTRFKGRVITVNIETVLLPNGHLAALEIVRHPGGAAIVALDQHNNICMLRQYRHAAGGWLWELPAGKLETGEPPLHTAQRELIEEAGVTASNWYDLGRMLPSPGVYAEVIYLFIARGLSPCVTAHEDHEVIEVHWLPFDEVWQRTVDGEYPDAKTAVAILRTHALLAAGRLPEVT